MRAILKAVLALACLSAKLNAALSISPSDAQRIAEKIWVNECGGTVAGLTSWNKGEQFASLGIGHFIWYPEGEKGPFHETFPDLLQMMIKEGAMPPAWLKSGEPCPWNSREAFVKEINGVKLSSLRQFLYETRSLQAIYMARRLEKALPQMVQPLSEKDREKVTIVFYRLANDPQGLYALMDYLNFKGLGTSPLEMYQGEGWGLKQVLLAISPASQDCLSDFVKAAKKILTQRVANSPPARHESRWLQGWMNRVESYKKL